jgi:hypothetical protein
LPIRTTLSAHQVPWKSEVAGWDGSIPGLSTPDS